MLTKNYEIIEELGRGKFGIVSHCISRKTNQHFAIKSIDKSLVSNDPIDKLSLTNEPKALTILSRSSTSPSYIICLHDVYDTPTHLHLVLDLVPHPTLYTLLSQRRVITEPEARDIAFSLLQSVLHCHQNGVIHRDIKPENIFVDPVSKRVSLCDFGSAGIVEEGTTAELTEVVGTPYYVAPEVLEGGGYGEKVDVWSVGVVLYVMIAGFPPFYAESVEEVFEKVLRGNLRFPFRVFGNVSSSFKDLIRKMLCRDVSRRISVQQALGHPWIENGGQSRSEVNQHGAYNSTTYNVTDDPIVTT